VHMPSKARNIADLLDSNGDVQADALDTQPQLGRRNLIINGAMQVWQRGTSGTTGYVADRFSATNVTSQTKTACDLVGFGSSITIVSPVADTSLIQQVENTDGKFAGQTLTFSFWAKTTTELPFDSDQYCEYYDESDAYQVLSVSVPSVIETNGDWKRYQRTFTLPSTAKGHMFGVRLDFRESVALTIEITGVQLELGSVATPFEHRSYGEELALCQRYYEVMPMRTYGDYRTTANSHLHWLFKVNKRATPSIIKGSGSEGTVTDTSEYGTRIYTSSDGYATFGTTAIADAEL
jgi:hypothetical protein